MDGMDPGDDAAPRLPPLVETYPLRCAVEGKSPQTLRACRETLGRFLAALAADGAPQ